MIRDIELSLELIAVLKRREDAPRYTATSARGVVAAMAPALRVNIPHGDVVGLSPNRPIQVFEGDEVLFRYNAEHTVTAKVGEDEYFLVQAYDLLARFPGTH